MYAGRHEVRKGNTDFISNTMYGILVAMDISPEKIKQFQKMIFDWYAIHKRDLPWRTTISAGDRHSIRDPYTILISEVMSQQTQISRVVPKYIAWMKAFPTIQDLAKASTRDVLFHWSGLGYNRRALYLKKCAEMLMQVNSDSEKIRTFQVQKINNITWPRTEKELRTLPGIGEYTARALLCFAFNEQVAVVDTNVRKVILTRIMNKELRIKQKPHSISKLHNSKESQIQELTNKEIQDIATKLLPKNRAHEWNQALMDYAAAELKNEKIHIPKQSKFKDSDRYYRGQILKRLLAVGSQSEKELLFFFEEKGMKLESERLERIIDGLKNEGMLEKKGDNTMLK